MEDSFGAPNGKTAHLTKIVDNLNSNKNREYDYDVLGRLFNAWGGRNKGLSVQYYRYDRYGNRTNVVNSGVAADGSAMPRDGIPNLTYDNASNRIATPGYEYDAAGNQTRSLAEDGTTWVKYEYDAANRLKQVRKDDVPQTPLQGFHYGSTNARLFDYDNSINRLKIVSSVGGTTMAEYTEFAHTVPTWTKSNTYLGNTQLSTITPNGTGGETVEFNHPDKLGTRTVTNQQAGTNYAQAHLPFGRPLDAESTGSTTKRFTSYERSDLTKLDYAINRTYDSKLGRFTQVDPIGIKAISPFVPQTLNMYSYCANDPVNYADPTGLFIGQFFRWLGRVLLGLSRSKVAKRIAKKFIVNFVVSGGNFGVAIRSIIPDILLATGIMPDMRSTVPWYPGSRLPISRDASPLSKYIILNLKGGPLTGAFCLDIAAAIDAIRNIADTFWKNSAPGAKTPAGLSAATEQSGRISYSDAMGGYFTSKVEPFYSNVASYRTRSRDGSPRGAASQSQNSVYDVFDIHTHPFEQGDRLVITGKHPEAGRIGEAQAPNFPSPSDRANLDPKLIGLIVTSTSIVVYTKVGRRCRFNR